MHIRRIELQGFKSFPDRTVLQFESGISAVVGPNGCGKSNIVEAVKWCLGEQKARSLRGNAMQDVIFSGSDTRAAMSVAEVTLVFEAADEPFPGEYAHLQEMAVTRRLFRDGSSEYLINRQKVRLKDVTDLFLDSGAGNRLYSFIEQGRIGEIVNARPDERRTLIEEAAGISRYKARRKEAEQRLGEVAHNLARVGETLGGMTDRMRSLEKQVARAMRHRRLRSALRQGEILLGLARFHALAADRRALSQSVKEAESAEAGLVLAVEQADARLRQDRANLDRLDAVVGATRDALSDAEARRRELESTRTYLQREREEQARQAESRAREGEDARLRLGTAQARRAQTLQARAEAEARLAEADAELEAARAEVRAAEGVQGERRRRIDAAKSAVMARIRDLARMRAELELSAQREADLSRRAAAAREAEGEALREIARVGALRDALGPPDGSAGAARVQAALLARDAAAAQVVEAERAVGAAQSARAAADAAVIAAQRAVAGAEARRSALAADPPSAGRRDLALARGRAGCFGTLAENLRVPAAWDGVLATALGDLLDAVLVADVGVARALVRDAGGVARVCVVPSVDGPVPAGIEGSPEGLRALAAALARAEACGSADAAWARYASGAASWSVEGPLWLDAPLFVRAGGAPGAAGAALERQRLRADADEALAQARPVLAEAEQRRAAAEETLVAARETLAQRQEARGRAIEAVREAESEAKAAAREREELDRQHRRADGARNAAAVELAEVTRATATLGGTRAALRQRIAEDEEQSSRAEEALTAEQALLADDARGLARSRETLQARATEAAALRERLVGLQRAVKDADESIDTAERLSQRCADEEAAARRRLGEIAAETAEAASTLDALQEELARLLQRLDVERERAQAERAALTVAEDALRAQRVKKDAATARRAELDRRLQAGRAEIAHLTEDIESRYGVGVAGLLDRLDRFGHIVLEVDPSVRVDDLPEAARPGRKDEELMEDLRVTVGLLEDAVALDLWRQRVESCRAGLGALGDVNLAALAEYAEVRESWRELDAQRADLQSSVTDLEQTIGRLNRLSRERFRETFERVDAAFRALYPRLVGGGEARLALTDEEDMLETGVDIFVQPPGKRLQAISLLSGGEMAMVAIALIFALFQVKPSPFCLLDEVDAPLDETNGARFNVMLREMAQLSQFIVVTHNRKTMEAVDTLYGVTMLSPGVSTLVSVQLH